MMAGRRRWVGALLGICFLWSSFAMATSAQSEPSAPAQVVPYVAPPNHLDLCGEPVPLHIQDVWERFDREFTILVYAHAQVYLWLKRAERFFPWFEEELKRRNLPLDLKYVAVAESDLQHAAYSPMGAAGMWQFIPGTGRRYGLDKSRALDERYDFELATDSALRYLKDLYDMFQNWTLAIAAYNCGEKRVQQEIERQKVRDYYQLKLPAETERYIFRILAIKAILSSPEKYGYALPEGAGYPQETFDYVEAVLKYPVPIQALAEKAGITYREFKRLNPAFISQVVPRGHYRFRLPQGRGAPFRENLTAFLDAFKPKEIVYRVKRGDTLTRIAKRYGVRVSQIKRWNRLKGSTIRVNQRLVIRR
ncbi:LysM domain-containing protein [Desulfacinum hydrothermale DSM 13146]|uniref:LysM domain-containing protein n=1 Tax=Desulfacinum hydrothermale DSM 13146 TaxID=1121390 RepID=A0A1W1X2W4_9BACT|nr:lytic transglycosylase domain-containing protein [Desulfacinum hydrothermale]SMC18068.1 LysM domain-containing protein [Desulfacinum hydrothermale DSM 13146]